MPPLDNPNCLQLKSIAHGSKASKKKSKWCGGIKMNGKRLETPSRWNKCGCLLQKQNRAKNQNFLQVYGPKICFVVGLCRRCAYRMVGCGCVL
jgi:hypothetical protein